MYNIDFIIKESTGPSAYHTQGLERIKLKEEREEVPDVYDSKHPQYYVQREDKEGYREAAEIECLFYFGGDPRFTLYTRNYEIGRGLYYERIEMPDIFGRIVGGVPDPKFKPDLWRFVQELEITARFKTADHAETVVKFAADIKTEKYGLSAQDYVKMFCEKLLHYLGRKENENGSSQACSSC